MKLLIVLPRVPYPLEKGDKLRAYNQLKELSKHHTISLFALNDQPLDPLALDELKKYCAAIHVFPLRKIGIYWNILKAFFSGIPLQVGYFTSSAALKKMRVMVEKQRPDHIYFQLVRTCEYAHAFPDIPKTLDYMDVFSKGVERRRLTAAWYAKPFFALEEKRLLKYEAKVFSWFQSLTIISEQDKLLIPHESRSGIVVVPNGVNMDYFTPQAVEKKYDVLFNGNMSYPPNIESVHYLVERIMPLVWEKRPGTKVLISGASPDRSVLALASDRVIVSGWVDDIRSSFAASKMLVAPMNLSIGLQNKLLEAMAMNIPCITSTLANNALKAENGKEILVADQPEKYAAAILELLSDPQQAAHLADSAFQFVARNYNWSKTTELLDHVFSAK